MTSTNHRTERNHLIWYMGDVRQCLLYPENKYNRTAMPHCQVNEYSEVMSIPLWDYGQVAGWLSSIGMGQYSNIFCSNKIDGIRLLTIDAHQLLRMGVKDVQHAFGIENHIRELSRSKRQAVGQIETITYKYYQALNLGRPPPHRYYGELLYPMI